MSTFTLSILHYQVGYAHFMVNIVIGIRYQFILLKKRQFYQSIFRQLECVISPQFLGLEIPILLKEIFNFRMSSEDHII